MIAVLIAVVAAAAAIAAAAYVRRRSIGVDSLARRTVVLHTKDDRSLRGVLTASHVDCLVLSHYEYLDEANPTDLPGEAVVLRSNVSWLQVLTEAAS